MNDLEYRTGTLMAFEPINMAASAAVRTLRLNDPVVVILEPGDATRYTLLLVPMRHGDSISPYLRSIGIQEQNADQWLFVSKLSGVECPSTWVPMMRYSGVGIRHVVELSPNAWSQTFLAWWFDELRQLYRSV